MNQKSDLLSEHDLNKGENKIMAVREIIKQGDPCLEKRCHPITRFDQRLWDLIDDMHQTLAAANGAGLAAPQIGILRRVALVADATGEMLELINPEIIEQEGEQEGFEGCLSLSGYWGEVTRPMWVKVKAQNRNGNFFEAEGEGMTARCFCHEIDHLDGKLYTRLCEQLYTTEQLAKMQDEMQEEMDAEDEDV